MVGLDKSCEIELVVITKKNSHFISQSSWCVNKVIWFKKTFITSGIVSIYSLNISIDAAGQYEFILTS
jgi:hypothetical protein